MAERTRTGSRPVDRDAVLDLAVDVVPPGMRLAFLVLFAVADPVAPAPVETGVLR